MHDLEKMVNIMETEYQLYNTLLDLSKRHINCQRQDQRFGKTMEAEEPSYLS